MSVTEIDMKLCSAQDDLKSVLHLVRPIEGETIDCIPFEMA